MTTLELRFLGGLTIYQGGMPLAAFKSQKGQALLCYLALTGKTHARSALAGLLWPEMPEENALMSLRTVLNKLNHHLATHLAISRQSIAFQAASSWIDVTEFEAGVTAKSGIGRLQAAMALYQGDFLDGFDLPDAPHFDGWVLAQRARLRQAALATLHHLVTHFAERGEHETAITYARQLLDIEPWQEEAHRELMHLLALAGQRSTALVQYETCRQILADELGVEPSSPTQALYERLAKDEPLLSTPVTAAPPERYRLGQEIGRGAVGIVYRAHDTLLDRPVAIKVLSPGASERPPHNLPLQLSSFVGREQEQAEVGRLLATSRLVTLTGPGGCGKTRLALQVAAGVTDTFAYGACFVELASLADPALAPQAVATALGVREEQARPLLTTLLAFLRQKQLLLLLDNCEHLLEACAQLADTLLRHCPQLVILTTSREALNIAGELAWVVPPLSLPDLQPGRLPDNPMQYDAIRLFIERAATAVPTLALAGQNDVTIITEVCHRLDGLPLAIELAAARVKTFTVAQIAGRLEPRFHLLTGGSRAALPRQQTLQATIDWSYNLLPPLEQTLFRRLSVFAGGWTLEAAEAVCSGEHIRQEEVAALLAHLVNVSLVVLRRQERYRMLETIRQFAQEKLVETGAEAEVRRRHLAYFMKLAEQADLAGPDQMVWVNRLQEEMDNFRAALAWSQEDQLEARLRLATALGLMASRVHELILFDISYHSLQELAKRLSQLLSQPGATSRTAVRAKALLAAAGLRNVMADYAHTGALAEESLAIYQELGNRHGEALSLLQLARAVSNMGDNVVSQSLTLESLSLFRALKDRKTVVEILMWMGAYLMKNDSQAQRYLEEALAICREQGDLLGVIQTLNDLGQWALFRGDFSLAHASLEESRTLQRSLGRPDIPVFLHLCGRLALYQGNYLHASAYLEQCLAIQRDHGQTEGDPWLLADLGYVALRLGEQGQARIIFAGVQRRFQEMGVKIGIVFALEGLASLAVAQSRPARAVRLFAWADAMRDTIGDTRPPVEQANVDRDLAAIQAHLDVGAIAAAVADGRAMTIEQVIAYALEE